MVVIIAMVLQKSVIFEDAVKKIITEITSFHYLSSLKLSLPLKIKERKFGVKKDEGFEEQTCFSFPNEMQFAVCCLCYLCN